MEQAQTNGINCYQADLDRTKLPFEDESLDVICANQIIEHLADTDGFIKEIYRVLKPGGYAIISTPNLGAWHCIVALLFGWQPYVASISDEFPRAGKFHSNNERLVEITPRHRRIFTLKALKEILESHGFKIERSLGSGFPPFPASLAGVACRIDKRHAYSISVKARKGRLEHHLK